MLVVEGARQNRLDLHPINTYSHPFAHTITRSGVDDSWSVLMVTLIPRLLSPSLAQSRLETGSPYPGTPPTRAGWQCVPSERSCREPSPPKQVPVRRRNTDLPTPRTPEPRHRQSELGQCPGASEFDMAPYCHLWSARHSSRSPELC